MPVSLLKGYPQIQSYFPTRYDSAAAEVVAILADRTEGYGRDHFGDSESPTGFVELVVLDQSCDLDWTDFTNYPRGDLAGETARTYGVTSEQVLGAWLVTTNSQGFVDVTRYDSEAAAVERFECLQDAFRHWEDEDLGEDGVYVCSVTGHGYHSL